MITKGSIYRAVYNVYGADDALTNPSTATLTITKPDGTTVTPSISLPPADIGILINDYTTTAIGWHYGLWVTTGPTTTKGFSFNVVDQISGSLLSLADAKGHLNITSTTNDEEILTFLDVVTVIVENRCGAMLPKTYVERYDGGQRLMLRHGPPVSVTAIEPWYGAGYGETVAPSAIVLDPVTWSIERIDGLDFCLGPYKVTYKAGRTVIPPNVLHGGRELLSHLWTTQRGPSTVGVQPAGLSEDELFAVAGRAYSVPRAVLEMLAPHDIGPGVG
jgi:hypothetical protein